MFTEIPRYLTQEKEINPVYGERCNQVGPQTSMASVPADNYAIIGESTINGLKLCTCVFFQLLNSLLSTTLVITETVGRTDVSQCKANGRRMALTQLRHIHGRKKYALN